MDLVNSWFPQARFLHIIRDGRDVALSHQTMPYGAGNIAECARAWVNRTTTNAKMGRILGAARYMTVRFERSEEHTSELQSLMSLSYAVFCLKKKKKNNNQTHQH